MPYDTVDTVLLLHFEFSRDTSHADDNDITLSLHFSHQVVMLLVFTLNLSNGEGSDFLHPILLLSLFQSMQLRITIFLGSIHHQVYTLKDY